MWLLFGFLLVPYLDLRENPRIILLFCTSGCKFEVKLRIGYTYSLRSANLATPEIKNGYIYIVCICINVLIARLEFFNIKYNNIYTTSLDLIDAMLLSC